MLRSSSDYYRFLIPCDSIRSDAALEPTFREQQSHLKDGFVNYSFRDTVSRAFGKKAAYNDKGHQLEWPFLTKLAPQVGLEPTTLRLTAGCSAIELLRNKLFQCRKSNASCPLASRFFIAKGLMSVKDSYVDGSENKPFSIFHCAFLSFHLDHLT